MVDNVFESFLIDQHDEAMALVDSSDLLDLKAIDDSRRLYIATFHAKGLTADRNGEVGEVDRVDIGIRLPEDYLRRVETAEVLTYLGPYQPWHPNIRPPYICLHLTPGMPLVDLLYACFELWTWNLYYTGDEGLNHAASQWARNQDPGRFPIDTRPLKRRNLQIEVQPVGGEADE